MLTARCLIRIGNHATETRLICSWMESQMAALGIPLAGVLLFDMLDTLAGLLLFDTLAMVLLFDTLAGVLLFDTLAGVLLFDMLAGYCCLICWRGIAV